MLRRIYLGFGMLFLLFGLATGKVFGIACGGTCGGGPAQIVVLVVQASLHVLHFAITERHLISVPGR